MKVVTEILQDLEILKRLLKHNANLKIRINYYLTQKEISVPNFRTFTIPSCENSVDPQIGWLLMKLADQDLQCVTSMP